MTSIEENYPTELLSAHSVSTKYTTYTLHLTIFQLTWIFFKIRKITKDCLSWFIKDVSFILAHHLSKLPLPIVTKETKTKDRGKHATYEEMIQTWVTYEVVKVLYLFGLNPKQKSDLESIAPDIERYIGYIESNILDDDNDDDDEESHQEIKHIHEIIFKHTQHSGIFDKCTFASMNEVKWKEDVKYMIPFLLLTWLRHLQQYFKSKKNEKHTWTENGNYQPHVTLSKGESTNPLAIVYLSKPGMKKPFKVKSYDHVKPYEPQNIKDITNVLIPSFEEWAMILLTPPNQTRLTQAIEDDEDTRRRWNMAEMKLCLSYKFEFNDKNYANKDKDKDDNNKNTELQPTLDYNNKTNEELHAEINNGLTKGKQAIQKITAKKTKSTFEKTMIDNMENMIRAYIALASKTFSSNYTTLEEIQIDLDSKIAQQGEGDKDEIKSNEEKDSDKKSTDESEIEEDDEDN
jgi:hypothetical protein